MNIIVKCDNPQCTMHGVEIEIGRGIQVAPSVMVSIGDPVCMSCGDVMFRLPSRPVGLNLTLEEGRSLYAIVTAHVVASVDVTDRINVGAVQERLRASLDQAVMQT